MFMRLIRGEARTKNEMVADATQLIFDTTAEQGLRIDAKRVPRELNGSADHCAGQASAIAAWADGGCDSALPSGDAALCAPTSGCHASKRRLLRKGQMTVLRLVGAPGHQAWNFGSPIRAPWRLADVGRVGKSTLSGQCDRILCSQRLGKVFTYE